MNIMKTISKRNSERGSTIIESVLVTLVLAIILFGLLQIFQLSSSQLIADYAAFRAARSASVGFNDTFAAREGRVNAIGASGDMIEPERSTAFGSAASQYAYEVSAIEDYLEGDRYMNYANWNGGKIRHDHYRCPFYGSPMTSENACGICSAESTVLHIGFNTSSDTVKTTLTFENYPLNMPFYNLFVKSRFLDLRSSAETGNYAKVFLED